MSERTSKLTEVSNWTDAELDIIEAMRPYYDGIVNPRQIDWALEAKKLPNITPFEMRLRWKNIRDKYKRREKKHAMKNKSKYYDSKLDFLDLVKPKIVVDTPVSDNDKDQPLPKTVEDNLEKYLVSMQTASKTDDYNGIFAESRKNCTPIEYNSIIHVNYKEQNTQLFFEKLGEYVIKRYPPEKYHEIKTEICSIIDKIEKE